MAALLLPESTLCFFPCPFPFIFSSVPFLLTYLSCSPSQVAIEIRMARVQGKGKGDLDLHGETSPENANQETLFEPIEEDEDEDVISESSRQGSNADIEQPVDPNKGAASKALDFTQPSQGPNADEQPHARPVEGLQNDVEADISDTSLFPEPETCGPVVMDEDMLAQLESHKGGMDVRLQCWDFPGQEEYALLNKLHFSERAIYLFFFDLTGKMEEEWRHISFWLWTIVGFSTDKDACPPILLIGTKAGAPSRGVSESELRTRLEDLQSRVPRLKEQLQRHPADLGSKCTKCPCLFRVENKGENSEAWISPLRMQLQRMALQFVSSRHLWENSDGSAVPRFVGLQAEAFPLRGCKHMTC